MGFGGGLHDNNYYTAAFIGTSCYSNSALDLSYGIRMHGTTYLGTVCMGLICVLLSRVIDMLPMSIPIIQP